MKNIGGSSGKGNGAKILQPIVHTIISPTFLCSISWTGRGKGKERKIPFSIYVNIVNMITKLVTAADKNYTQVKTIEDLKYKIIKHAPAKYGTQVESDQSNLSVDVQTSSRYI